MRSPDAREAAFTRSVVPLDLCGKSKEDMEDIREPPQKIEGGLEGDGCGSGTELELLRRKTRAIYHGRDEGRRV